MIEVENISKWYADFRVLSECTTRVDKGEVVVVCGPSGSGKTTLLYCLSALEKITEGKIFLDGEEVSKYTEKGIADLRKTSLGFIFQFYNLIPNLTVYENILLARIIAKKDNDNILDMLDLVGLKDFKDYYPNQLSGGMQQRVAIARALINNPKIIFADEPTGNLDQKNGREIMELLTKLNKEKNVTIVLVTHNEDYIDYCSKVIRLLDGRVV